MGAPMGMHHMMGRDADAVAGKSISRDTWRKVWGFARKYRWMIVGFLAAIIGMSILAILPGLLLRQIIDVAIADENTGYLNRLALFMIAAAFGAAVLSFLERIWSSRIGEGLIYDLRVALFDHVQRMPLSFFTRTQTGSLISRLNNDVVGAQRAVTSTLASVVSNTITLVITLIAMLYLEWRGTLVALVLLPCFIIPAKRVGRNLAGLTRDSMNLNASMNATMTERFNVSGALLVKLFGRPGAERDSFADRAGKVRDIGVKSAMYGRVFVIALTLVGAVGTAVVYWIGGRLAIEGTITVGTLTAMGIYVVQIYAPLTALTNARVDLLTAFVSFERVFEVLDAENPIADRPNAAPLGHIEGRVQFEGVDFAYPTASQTTIASLEGDFGAIPNDAGRNVLSGIELVIEPGQMVAVVGPSGAGKSTLISLIPRLYDVTAGAVRIDGIDIRDVQQDSLRRRIGVVSQDPHMFHDTVRANLTYARPEATEAEITEACEAARILDVINRLPDGLDTMVGERGYRLSGGEKQRLAIARMLLKNPEIVVLDEATSHLDSENEHLVQEALANALRGRTSLVIAHRLSTIVDADQIIVIDDGAIVERGTHDELRASGGLYADLYETLQRQ